MNKQLCNRLRNTREQTGGCHRRGVGRIGEIGEGGKKIRMLGVLI